MVSQPLFFSGYEIAPSFLNHLCFCLRFLRFHLFFGGVGNLRPKKTAPCHTSKRPKRPPPRWCQNSFWGGSDDRRSKLCVVCLVGDGDEKRESEWYFLGILRESVGNYCGSLGMIKDSSLWICFCWWFFADSIPWDENNLKLPIFWNIFLGNFFHEFETHLSSYIFTRFITSLCGIGWVYGWERYFVSSNVLSFLMQCKHCINTLTPPLFLSNLGFCIGVAVDFPVEIQLVVFSLFKPFLLWCIYSEGILLSISPRISEFNDFSWNMATGETARAPNASLLNHDYGKDSGFRGLVLVMWLYLL